MSVRAGRDDSAKQTRNGRRGPTHIAQHLVHVLPAISNELLQGIRARHVDARRRVPQVVQADVVRHLDRDVFQLRNGKKLVTNSAARWLLIAVKQRAGAQPSCSSVKDSCE
jgi:hypothetical protein